jgi:bacterioferritin
VQGNQDVIEVLNEILTAELTAINQYFIHAKMCDNWGYQRLAEHVRHESIDEMKDAEDIIDRILYLDGTPNMQRLNPVRVGETVVEQLGLDRQLEVDAVERYNRAIEVCTTAGDHGTRELLEDKLTGEEAHLDWLETQLTLVDQLGVELYLSTQVND